MSPRDRAEEVGESPWCVALILHFCPEMERPPREPDKPSPRPSATSWVAGAVYLIALLALFAMWQGSFEGMSRRTISYSDFKAYLARGEVSACVVGEQVVEGVVTPGEQAAELDDGEADTEPFRFRAIRVDDPQLVQQLVDAGVEYSGSRPSLLTPVLLWLLPFALIIGLWIVLSRRMGSPGGSLMSPCERSIATSKPRDSA